MGGVCLVPVRRFPSPSRSIRFGDVSEANGRETLSHFRIIHVTRNALAGRKNEAQGLGKGGVRKECKAIFHHPAILCAQCERRLSTMKLHLNYCNFYPEHHRTKKNNKRKKQHKANITKRETQATRLVYDLGDVNKSSQKHLDTFALTKGIN